MACSTMLLSNPGWAACAMYDKTGHGRPSLNFKVRGIYGRVFVDGKSLICNEPSAHTDSIGVPPGHPPLKAFLGVPLSHEGKTIGVLALANREGGYRTEDLEVAESLAPAIVEALMRKKAADALRRSQAILSEAQRIAHLGNWEWDIETGEVSWSEEMYRIFGLETLSFHPSIASTAERIHPDDREAFGKLARDLVRDPKPVSAEYRIVRPDGSLRWVHGRGEAVAGEGGKPVRLVGTAEDITERKQAEVSLVRAAQLLGAHIDNSPLAVIEFDPQFRVTRWSDGAQRLFGWTAEETIGKAIGEMRWVYDEDMELVKQLSADMFSGELLRNLSVNRNYRKDGSVVHCEWYNSAIRGADGKLASVLSLVLDVTERKRAEEELKKHPEHLEELVKERTARLQETVEDLHHETQLALRAEEDIRALSGRLVSVQEEERRAIARELHDEVGQYLTFVRMMLERAIKSPGEEIAPILREATDQVADLLKRVRNLSLDLRPSMLDDLGLVPALLWLFERLEGQSGLQVSFSRDSLDSFSPKVNTAAYRIIQEGLTNVVRHAGTKEATVNVRADDDTLYVELADRGRGFDMAAAANGPSTGLSSMRERARMLGGVLKLESAPGAGTRISAELPLHAPGAPHLT